MTEDNLIKTTVPGLLKNKKTGTVLNTNIEEYNLALAGRQRNKEIQTMKQEIVLLQIRIEMILDHLGMKVNG